MKNTKYTGWSKTEGRGKFTSLTARDIVEGLFGIENVDDYQLLVDDIEDEIEEVENNLEYLEDGILVEGEDDIEVTNMNHQFFRFNIESTEEAEAFLKDVQEELESQKQMIEDLIAEEKRQDSLEQTRATFERFNDNIQMNLGIQRGYVEGNLFTITQVSESLWNDHESLLKNGAVTEIRHKLKVISNVLRDAERELARLQELEGKAEVMRAVMKEVE